MSIIVANLNEISAALGVAAFLGFWIVAAVRRTSVNLEVLLGKTFAAGALRTAFLLLACAFDRSLTEVLVNFNIQIAAAGLSLLFISTRVLTK